MLMPAGNRIAAIALLWSAVAIDPVDLTAHRRLAAALAVGGDIDAAANEYARYVEFMLPLGRIDSATKELAYGTQVLGWHPALRAAAEKIAVEVIAAQRPKPQLMAGHVELETMPSAAQFPGLFQGAETGDSLHASAESRTGGAERPVRLH
jgi:hypothetical protein